MQEYPNGPSNGNNDTPLNLVVVNDELLLEHLDRKVVPGHLLLREEDGPEGALRDGLDDLKVLDRRRGGPRQRRDRRKAG